MGLADHININLKQGVKIITCDPPQRLIEAETRNGEVISINAYYYSPTFRWPVPGEKWMVTEENGSWFLTGIYEQQVAPYEEWSPTGKYTSGAIVKYEGKYWKREGGGEGTPGKGAPWKLFKVPQVKAGDSVITASSGRILQNQEGTITEVPNGLKVPFIPVVSGAFTEAEFLAMADVINEIRQTLKIYHMMEEKVEVNPEAHFHTSDGTHLDALHGPRTAAEFTKRCDLSATFPEAEAVIAERIHDKDFTIVEVIWTIQGKRVAALRLHLEPKRAHYDRLMVEPEYRGQGFYQALIKNDFSSWWGSKGVEVMSANPESQASERVLAMGGFHWQAWNGQRLFSIRLDQRDRRDEYREWLEGGSDTALEPEWHKELRLPPKLL